MSKYDIYNDSIIDNLDAMSNNTHIAKKLFPEGTAKNRMKSELKSQIQGHLHTQLYVEYAVGANFIIFGMQVGCGVDNKSYAMAYGKHYKKPAIGCGVVINKGALPIAIPMKM